MAETPPRLSFEEWSDEVSFEEWRSSERKQTLAVLRPYVETWADDPAPYMRRLASSDPKARWLIEAE